MANHEACRILHLEDDELDRELVRQALEAERLDAAIAYAASGEEFARALETAAFDLILSDFTLPGYGGAQALALAREKCPGVPFIFMSGTIGEKRAIACLKDGATDYVLKNDPGRLVPAIRRALREAAERRKRCQAEADLRESEQRYRFLFDHNPQPMWMYDVESLRFLAVNDAAVTHFGWSRKEFLQLTILDIRPPEDVPALRVQLQKGASGLRVGETWRHRKKDGTLIEVEIAAHEVPAGERKARLVVVNDVTARNRALEALDRERTLMRMLIDQIPDLIYVKDNASRFLLANESLARLMGARGPADLLGRTDADFRPAALAASYRADEERVLAGEPLINKEEPAVLPDGSKRLYLTTKLPLRDRDGRITGLFGIGRDITEHQAAEEARRQSDARFAAIFQSSPIGLGYGTADGRLRDANRQLCELLGYTREELLSRSLQELGLWARPEDTRAPFATTSGEKAVRNHELKFVRQSGEVRTGLLSLEPLRFGSEPALLAMLVDITDHKQLESELLRANRVQSVGRLASGIAHDMNNILAPIMMAVPLLRMDLSRPEVEKMLGNIELSARRGAELVKQLLMFGRGVEGERGPVRLAVHIADVLKIASETFPKNIVVRTNIAPDTWAVRGDASQLHQVILNLCVNARDAMPNGGTLTVETRNAHLDELFVATHPEVEPGDYVRLSVADTGTGIPLQIMDKIFDPFFTTKSAGQGTGLGLSTVLGIVKSHDGLVTVHSAESAGTTFEIYLPAIPVASEAAPAPPPGAPPRGNNELLLLVDDEENIRSVVRHALTQHNYRVLVASDGAEAAAVFARNLAEIKLVVTDLDMPYMNGPSLARTLQRLKPQIKILVSSGLGSARNARQWGAEIEALGLPPVLPKPYPIERLLTLVHELLVERDAPPPAAIAPPSS